MLNFFNSCLTAIITFDLIINFCNSAMEKPTNKFYTIFEMGHIARLDPTRKFNIK